jgi:predicted nucleotide-binding protein
MARKPSPPPQPPSLTPDQIRQGIDRLKRRIGELQAFDPNVVTERWAPETKAIEVSIDETLSRIFGHNTPRYHRYQRAADLDHGGVVLGGGPDPIDKVRQWLREGKADALALLNQAVKGLEEDLAESGADTRSIAAHTHTIKVPIDDMPVFIVHGRDSPAKVEVARLLERAGLDAVILHEQPNAGRTLIEKFEHHGGSAGFAVVLLTPDDVGGPDKDHLQPRARQNVIGEMFWFAGKLNRRRVCALKKGDLELPSDAAGIVYTEMDDRGAWKSELLRELQTAGYTVDWARALA